MKTNRKGFTLIELLVVVAVIGILASVVLLGLGQVRGRGRDARRIADLKQLQNSLELYFNTCSRYPAGLVGLTSTDATCANGTPAAVGPTINQMPADPSSNGVMYDYCVGGVNNNRYILGALLEDLNNPVLQQQVGATFNGCGGGVSPAQNGGTGAARACFNGLAPGGTYCTTI